MTVALVLVLALRVIPLRPDDLRIAVLFVVVSGIYLVVFPCLTIVVGDGSIDCYFGFGLFRRVIEAHEVASARIVTLLPFQWGIRTARWRIGGPRSTWSATGWQHVELALTDGSVFRMSASQPAELIAAIDAERVATGD